MSRSILVTGATGQQGGAVVDALIENATPDEFTILAVTRNTDSAAAKRLLEKSPNVKLVRGDLNDIPGMFENAKLVSPSIWGTYAVTMAELRTPDDPTIANETKQGVALVDESIKAGVKFFVYSSVDRGGEERSWNNPTSIPHFKTKHLVEEHLKAASEGTGMQWTILRPVIFFDNLQNNFQTKVLLTAIRDTMGDKPMPWIAAKDIGRYAALAFRDPTRYNHRALSLGTDSFDWKQLNQKFIDVTGQPAPTTYSFLGSAFKWGLKDLGLMIDWFRDEGYQADVAEMRRLNPKAMDMDTYIRQTFGDATAAK